LSPSGNLSPPPCTAAILHPDESAQCNSTGNKQLAGHKALLHTTQINNAHLLCHNAAAVHVFLFIAELVAL
jgi:hypothetical protein